MTIKRLLFRTALRTVEWVFLRRSPRKLYTSRINIRQHTDPRAIDVVTIAFNNPKIIALHNRYVGENLKGESVHHIVVDNSSKAEASKAIQHICEEMQVPYVRLHRNRMGWFGSSYSHAAALNWTYRQLLKPRAAYGFGFIDHDIFPVAPIDIASKLQAQPLYGARRQRGEKAWYLSAIMCFLRHDLCQGRKVDFMPVNVDGHYLDTGGGNWFSIYRHLDGERLHFVSERIENFREGDQRHQDQVELFDGDRWVHTINGSYWKHVAIEKETLLEALVGNYAQQVSEAEQTAGDIVTEA